MTAMTTGGWHPPGAEQGWAPPAAPQPSQPGWGAPAPPESRPGVIPLRPLAVGEVLDGVFSTIRRHPRLVLGMSAVVATVQAIASVVVPGLLGAFTFQLDATSTTTAETEAEAFQLVSQLLGVVVTSILGAVLAGAIVVIVGEAVLGRPVTAQTVWARLRRRVWALLWCSLVVGLVPIIGLLFLIAPGVWLWAAWSLATPALVLEGLGPIRAVKRSFRLVRGAWWRTFFIRVLAWLIAGVVASVIAAPFAIVGALVGGGDFSDGAPPSFVMLYALGITLGATITLPFSAGVQALLYVDRRIRAEALDVTLAEAAAQGPASP